MIDTLKYEIKRILSKDNKYVSDYMIYYSLLYLFNLKYLCDNENYEYSEIIKLDDIVKIKDLKEQLTFYIGRISIHKLLPLIQYEDLAELTKELISSKQMDIPFIDKDINKLCIATSFENICYDLNGKTTYITDKLNQSSLTVEIFKFFDKILNLNNKYVLQNEVNFNDYSLLYIYDFMPKYRFIKYSDNDTYDYIQHILKNNKHLKIVLHTDFKKISNMNDAKETIKYLDKVIFYDDINTFLLFMNKDDDNISIINYNKDKISDSNRLDEIINNNRKIKNILTKTTGHEIVINRYRLGFKLYQNKLNEDKIDINKIVDENTRLIERLASLNKSIEAEINKLMNR